ncbi:MAG: hypothetical protein MHM6MM_001546 [Cercozoa sp. M6MM]
MEKSASASTADLKSTVTKTVNKFGEKMLTETTSAYEQAAFARGGVRAVAAAGLAMRTGNIYVPPEEETEEVRDEEDESTRMLTYVLPENLLKKLVAIADLRTQVAVMLYGKSPEVPEDADADEAAAVASVKEVHAAVIPPQTGTHRGVQLPVARLAEDIDKHPLLEDLQPLGWLHTQPSAAAGTASGTTELRPDDVLQHARIAKNNTRMSPAQSALVTCTLDAGMCQVTAHRITKGGYRWANEALERADGTGTASADDMSKFEPRESAQRVQLLLSGKFRGFFLVPDVGPWHYNFCTAAFSPHRRFGLRLDVPPPFYAQRHRLTHFLKFHSVESHEEDEGADVEDFLS